jgi:hypothetical protein
MLIKQILRETTQEDSEIHDIAELVTQYLHTNYGKIVKNLDEPIGIMGELINYSAREPAIQELLNAQLDFETRPGYKGGAYGKRLITISADEFQNNPDWDDIETSIAHEARHILDTIKSKSVNPRGYNKRSRDTSDEHSAYQSTPAEINARTEEAQQALAKAIKRYVESERDVPTTEQIIPIIKQVLDNHNIARYFPRGTDDKDYRRIVNRLLTLADFSAQKYYDQL